VGLTPKRILNYHDNHVRRVVGVRWVRSESGYWSRPALAPLPAVRLLSRAVVSDDPMNQLKSVDLATTAILDRPIQLENGPPGRVSAISDPIAGYAFETESAGARVLVVARNYHSSWRAEVDGRPTDTFRVYGDFLGCRVEGGRHLIRFIWTPKWLFYGAAVSLASLTIAFAFFGAGVVRSRRCVR
jgi:hypothetical protein